MGENKMIRLPFNIQFKEPMLKGQKTMTSRTSKYGNVGDEFQIFDRTFIITKIYPELLGVVADNHFYEEGFKTRQEFIDFWIMIHPVAKFQLYQKIYVHRFQRKVILED